MSKNKTEDFESDEPIHIPSQIKNIESADENKEKEEVVVNIRLVKNTASEKVVVLDSLEGTDVTDSLYTMRIYSLYPTDYSMGMFQLLDDYFTRRFGFFHSSKSCQALMMAFVDVEREFIKKSSMSLFDYCAKITKHALEVALSDKDVDNDGNYDKLCDGYGISKESIAFNNSKPSIGNKKLMRWAVNLAVDKFIEYMDYIETKHFCAIAVTTLSEVPPSICSDPFINLPITFYIPGFAKILLNKIGYSFLSQEFFKEAGIDSITAEIFLVMPTMTVADINAMMDKDNEVVDYDKIEEHPKILGRYEKFVIKEGKLNPNKFDSIIAYN